MSSPPRISQKMTLHLYGPEWSQFQYKILIRGKETHLLRIVNLVKGKTREDLLINPLIDGAELELLDLPEAERRPALLRFIEEHALTVEEQAEAGRVAGALGGKG